MGLSIHAALHPPQGVRTTAIKICGITRPDDAVAVAASGVEAMGLMFAPRSARRVDPKTAQRLVVAAQQVARTKPLLNVGVFVNATTTEVQATLDQVELDVLQFHGSEDAQFCAQFLRPYVKAIPMTDTFDVVQLQRDYPDAAAWLVDTAAAGQFGGTGNTFDWQRWPTLEQRAGVVDKQSSSPPPLWALAGGLDATNVAAAIQTCQPTLVDLSGGVEDGHKGHKSADKIQALVAAVAAADAFVTEPSSKAKQ